MAIHSSMATQTIKSTYSLDLDTVRALDRLARRWKVTKSEALRRAIHASARGDSGEEAAADAISALEALQASIGLDEARAREWERASAAERRASSQRTVRRGR